MPFFRIHIEYYSLLEYAIATAQNPSAFKGSALGDVHLGYSIGYTRCKPRLFKSYGDIPRALI